LRKSLVVVQFAISITVIIAMIVVQQQISFMDKKDLGFDKNNLLSISYGSWDGKGQAFKNEVLNIAGVESASRSTWLPAGGAGYMSKDVEDPANPDNKLKVWYITADIDFARTMGLRAKQGRLFDPKYATDAVSEDSLLNDDYKKHRDIIAKAPALITSTTSNMLQLKLNEASESIEKVPVGIIQDFHNTSLHSLAGPTVITADNSISYSGMLIRVKPGSEAQVLSSVHA
jgi:putative ABC transport system permease protein